MYDTMTKDEREQDPRDKVARELERQRPAKTKWLHDASQSTFCASVILGVADAALVSFFSAVPMFFTVGILGFTIAFGCAAIGFAAAAERKEAPVGRNGDAVTREINKNPAKYGLEPLPLRNASLSRSISRVFAAACRKAGPKASSFFLAPRPQGTAP
jgi:hypothetical protein